MIQSGYTKLFGSIVASTIWREDDKTRIVWITLLALSDKDGYVAGSIPGLADLARVSLQECEQALEKLQKPDMYSRSPEHDGRRIDVVDGGWFILNRTKYRDAGWEEERTQRHREANRRYYERKRTKNSDNSDIRQSESDQVGDKKEKEKEKEKYINTSELKSSSDSLSPSRRKKPRKTPLPENFGISNSIRQWAEKKHYTRLEERLEHFVGYVKANGKSYADWDQAFQNAIRDDWAKLNHGNGKPAVSKPVSAAEKTQALLAAEERRVM